ncbi:MAG: penicillin-binding protein 2 [Candidatus Paceibacterota bacterium]|jgi:cell division protein FtsI (penicillin-binding protein 3)/stage V sporulation protein D (sporulation-specific penicillin-binding protein)
MKSSFVFRTRIIFFCISLFALILIGKLFLVQIVHSSDYSEKADRQYFTPSAGIFERGTIYFSRKDGQLVSAAMQTTGFKIAINPVKIIDKESVFEQLSKIITLNHDQFLLQANKENDPYEEIATHLSKEEADAVNLLKISGLSIVKEKWRFYPGVSLASQSLGFVAYKGDELGGRYGLERQYNAELSRDKNSPYINFFAEVFSNINETLFSDETERGDIVTTIEPSVQSFLEKTLEGVKEKYQVDSIGGIIMNPTDGSIYALSTKPDFDLNNFSKVQTVSTFSNPLVENVLEFGSIVKPLVMAGALDAGVVTANTTYNDKGSVIVEDKEIFNFDKKARGVVNMQEVLNQSLNTGMVFVYKKLGKEKMRDYMLSYGIKDKTGIDLPNETSGLVSNIINSPRDLEYANAAFGQGIALTPVEMIRALASLSNGGNLVVPHVVQKIKYNNGNEKEMKYETKPTKISVATGEEITRMLVNVMDKAIQGGNTKLEHHSVAVKTGTAQVANSDRGGYYEDRHIHSFFGYFPAYDPKFIILLYAINPKGVPYAVQTWADPFLSITKFLINYYEVPPDR